MSYNFSKVACWRGPFNFLPNYDINKVNRNAVRQENLSIKNALDHPAVNKSNMLLHDATELEHQSPTLPPRTQRKC